MRESRKKRELEEKKIQADFASGFKKIYKVYKAMIKKGLNEYQKDDLLVRIGEDGHLVGKVGRVYVQTVEENGKTVLKMTTKTVARKYNKTVLEEKDYGKKYTQIRTERAYLDVIVENGKFKKAGELMAEVRTVGIYTNDEEKVIVETKLKDAIDNSLANNIEAQLENTKKNSIKR